ncbi:MAG: N-acetylmuramic acid 6-phosphate etherase [Thermoanaerobaculia bacterium]
MSDPTSSWGRLPTEARHPESADLDLRPSAEVVALLVAEEQRGLARVAERAAEIAEVADWTAAVLAAGGDVLFAGAGTSGRLGVLEAAECPPTFGTAPERIRAVMAGGDGALFRAVEGAEDVEEDGRASAATLRTGDLLIAISASSVTPYARGAIAGARQRGARTVLLTCAAPAGLEGVADRVVALDTGPEILTGSTRLKAGSATKAALNAITTTAMVRSGKVFGNLMVDLRPGSAKLVDRARRIVETAGGVDRDAAAGLLSRADGEVKTAIVMARTGSGPEEARRRLSAAAGAVREAIAERNPAC